MRDEKKFLGDDIKKAPEIFVGAAANPFADPIWNQGSQACKKDYGRRRVHSNPVHLQPG